MDKTQQEFKTMQVVLGGCEEKNGDEKVGEIESFYSVFSLEDMTVLQNRTWS